eukprot:Seg893.7 transcript_id=Seg893.7/GoldUCD/mRNA.D3Y31 product="hypothetical protein" protein_id=Seg893.7/GoldUCD/D3Y31
MDQHAIIEHALPMICSQYNSQPDFGAIPKRVQLSRTQPSWQGNFPENTSFSLPKEAQPQRRLHTSMMTRPPDTGAHSRSELLMNPGNTQFGRPNSSMVSQLSDIGVHSQPGLIAQFQRDQPLFPRQSSGANENCNFPALATPVQKDSLTDQLTKRTTRKPSQSQFLTNTDKPVDAWIDELNIDFESTMNPTMSTANITLRLLAHQGLPRLNISLFNGSTEDWIDFVINFRDLIHLQEHLSNTEKMSYLLQHLEGEAKRAVMRYSRDKFGYV